MSDGKAKRITEFAELPPARTRTQELLAAMLEEIASTNMTLAAWNASVSDSKISG